MRLRGDMKGFSGYLSVCNLLDNWQGLLRAETSGWRSVIPQIAATPVRLVAQT
jgi:hypothetical protein